MANQVDVKTLSAEEQRLYRKYGKIPSRSDMFHKKLHDRKYFDSGDYALSQAGHTATSVVGSKHPNPDTIPRANTSPKYKR
ncbi:hypothetical protein TRVA0_084S00276 [Trichomonascus vanleenenianus]|uniref:uncharacterized protein n=1 Tax=Trichomonascus vanleenenianus TaxID=2268995 RepID=UPI003ECB5E69